MSTHGTSVAYQAIRLPIVLDPTKLGPWSASRNRLGIGAALRTPKVRVRSKRTATAFYDQLSVNAVHSMNTYEVGWNSRWMKPTEQPFSPSIWTRRALAPRACRVSPPQRKTSGPATSTPPLRVSSRGRSCLCKTTHRSFTSYLRVYADLQVT